MTADETQINNDTQSSASPRRPGRAALLIMLAPGLGQMYAGYPRRGIVVWVLNAAALVVAMHLLLLFPGRIQLIAVATFVVVLQLVIAWDAARMARGQPLTYTLRPYNRWYVYVAAALFVSFIAQPLLTVVITRYVGRAHRLPSGSMAPTLLRGDYVLASSTRRPPRRGELVVYGGVSGKMAKRVIALPGDTVQMRDGVVTIGGVAVLEPYAVRDTIDHFGAEFAWQRELLPAGVDFSTYRPSLHNWGPLVIPSNQYFVLGDNRNNSLDSRYVGLVPADSIEGRPALVYFSRDSESGEIRWQRIGLDVRVPPPPPR